jgi:hypothetical protein
MGGSSEEGAWYIFDTYPYCVYCSHTALILLSCCSHIGHMFSYETTFSIGLKWQNVTRMGGSDENGKAVTWFGALFARWCLGCRSSHWRLGVNNRWACPSPDSKRADLRASGSGRAFATRLPAHFPPDGYRDRAQTCRSIHYA